MNGIRLPANGLSAIVILFGMLASDVAAAQDQPIKRTELLRSDLADVPGKQTVIYVADVVPGGEGQRHTHHGDEYVYILEGTLTIKPDGKDPITLGKGQAAHIAPADGICARWRPRWIFNRRCFRPTKMLRKIEGSCCG